MLPWFTVILCVLIGGVMDHNLFKVKSLEEGKEAVVGHCNGFDRQQRWDAETPDFAKAIRSQIHTRNDGGYALVLDYGCGVGRLAKAVMSREEKISVKGIDASADMMREAEKYCGDTYTFQAWTIKQLAEANIKFDVAYCVYVLQHVPAIEIREILQRIYDNLKDDGTFVYCSSDFRMAIKFDGSGFGDDRSFGVNLQEEVGRYFDRVGPLFTDEVLKNNNILRVMVTGEGGNLPHPAFVYKKKKIVGPLYNAITSAEEASATPQPAAAIAAPIKDYTKLVLVNRLAPGDILVMTNAVRDLHKTYPGKYQVEVRTPCNPIFDNNPYCTKLAYDESEYQKEEVLLHRGDRNGHVFTINNEVMCIDMHYPIIHESGTVGWHFGHGHTVWLEEVLGVPIRKTDIRPEIFMSQTEMDWISPVLAETGYSGDYWCINSGSKGDYTLKQYHQYQEVVNLLKDRVKFVQIGQAGHSHSALDNVINMVGKTNDIRKLFRVIHKSLGVLTCVSFPMHIAAAFNKPCVVVAGAREGTRWELYPNHRFIYLNGCLPCASYDGCWKSKIEDCINKVGSIPKCMTMIKPERVADEVMMYYEGGIIAA